MKDFKKVDEFSPEQKNDIKSSNKDYCFIFVGYGWSFYRGFLSKFSLDEFDPDEAFKLAVEEFKIYFPCCNAAVFYQAEKDNPIFYRFYIASGTDSENVDDPRKR